MIFTLHNEQQTQIAQALQENTDFVVYQLSGSTALGTYNYMIMITLWRLCDSPPDNLLITLW